MIEEGWLLVSRTRSLKQKLGSSVTRATSPQGAVRSWRGTKARSICHCAVTPRPVFLQMHPLLTAWILFGKKIMTTLDKFFIPGKITKDKTALLGIQKTWQIYCTGSPAHLPMADSLQLRVEDKRNRSDTAWALQAFCVCITHFSAWGIPRETCVTVRSVIGKC